MGAKSVVLTRLLMFSVASLLVVAVVEGVVCGLSGARGEWSVPGTVRVLFIEEYYGVIGVVGPVEGLLEVDESGGGTSVSLRIENESVVSFLIDGRGDVYVELPGSGERVKVGGGVTPLYAPRPGIAAPVCLPGLRGEYLGVRVGEGGFVEYSSVMVEKRGAGTVRVDVVDVGMVLKVKGPLLARVQYKPGNQARGQIVDVPVLSSLYASGVAVRSSFAVKADWLGPGVDVPERAWLALVAFDADVGSVEGKGYPVLPWWPAMIAASLITGGLAAYVSARRD